jgi:hypothetical protein
MNKAPAWLMLIGGLILAIGPWITQIPVPIDPFVEPPNHEGAWVFVIEETSERSPAVARVHADASYWDSLVGRGLKWRFYDVDSPDALTYRTKAEAAGIPALVVVSKDAAVLAAKPLPATTDGIDAIVKEATGR